MRQTFIYIAAIIMATACARELIPEEEPLQIPNSSDFIADHDLGTRSSMGNALAVNWEEEDEISVFAGEKGRNRKYALTEGAGTSRAVFSGASYEEDVYYALYPYNNAAVLTDGKISARIPSEQKAVNYGFAPGVNVAAAKSDNHTLTFMNVCSLLRIRITRSDLTFIGIRGNGGEILAGDIMVDFTGDEPVAIPAGEGEAEITLVPSEGRLKPGVYYIAVIPQDFPAGLTVTLNADAGNPAAKVNYSGRAEYLIPSVSLERSAVKNIDCVDSSLAWSYEGVILKTDNEASDDNGHWIDFQTGSVFYATGGSAGQSCEEIDAGGFYSANASSAGFYFLSPGGSKVSSGTVYSSARLSSVGGNIDDDLPKNWGKRLNTRFFLMSDAEMDDEAFDGLSMASDIKEISTGGSTLEQVASSSSLSPTDSPAIKNTCFVAFKTYSATEGNRFGVIRVKEVSKTLGARQITFDYKIGGSGNMTFVNESIYNTPSGVSIEDGKVLVNGVEWEVKGAACNGRYSDLAGYGGNTVRAYSARLNFRNTLDQIYESGSMTHLGLPFTQYRSNSKVYTDDTAFQTMLDNILLIVDDLRNHPAVLCWCIGNELESEHQEETIIWDRVQQAAEAIRALDPAHPITVAVTSPSQTSTKITYIAENCPDLDFLSVNCYQTNLAELDDRLVSLGWNRPFMVTEFGPTGTWSRNYLDGRITDWNALVELSSSENAAQYQACLDIISGYGEACIGSFPFLWGHQTHGEVLSWYGMFTKEGYALPSVEVMSRYWNGEDAAVSAPVVKSYRTSIELNGVNLSTQLNNVVSSSQACTAKVYASSENPLRYRWFIYRDNVYDDAGNITEAAHACADGSMDENANADLFVDRTQKAVTFNAPSEAGNYRLHVLVFDDKSRKAAQVSLPFRVQ